MPPQTSTEGEIVGRLPLSHPLRISFRDLKLWKREETRARRVKVGKLRCPCNECKCTKTLKLSVVQLHLYKNGRYDLARTWSDRTEWDSSDEEWWTQENGPARDQARMHQMNSGGSPSTGFDQGLQVERMVAEAFNVLDAIREQASHATLHKPQDPEHPDQNFELGGSFEEEGLEQSMEGETSERAKTMNEACKPLYDGSTISKLGFTMVLINILGVHGAPNVLVDELLAFFEKAVLPKGNVCPKSHGQAKVLIGKLGLNYNTIHACPKGCILFRGEFQDYDACPKCGQARYKQIGKALHAQKVLRHFPLIPRLKRMYQCKSIAQLMLWSDQNKSTDGMVRHTADSKQWAHIDETWPQFSNEPRNVRLGLALDGVNPFSDKSTQWSTWPILLLNYNLPPWLVTKNFFIQLALLIPGKESVHGKNIDIFLEPLLEELQLLWTGVDAWDASAPLGNQAFKLHAILIWTINDYPALGTISGQAISGYKACVHCGPNVRSEYSHNCHKHLYRGHRRYLPVKHAYRSRRNGHHFNNTREDGLPPLSVTSYDIADWADKRRVYLEGGGEEDGAADPAKQSGIKRLSILFRLPYWKDLLIRHLLDVMHTEKNISEHILKTIWGEKDSVNVRKQFEVDGIKKHLWLQPHPRIRGRLVKPKAPYVLSKEEKTTFVERISSLRVPSGYSGAWKKHILVSKKLGNMKSHDYHVLIQQVLPVCLRGLMDPEVNMVIMRLSRVFRRLCTKVWNPTDTFSLQQDVIMTICLLEMHFPPSFFVIMTHLLVHLVEELDIAGPVHTRWMYPIERYLSHLKKYVKSRARPEGSIAECYILEEAMGFITEYMEDFEAVKTRVWDKEEEEGCAGEELEGIGIKRCMSIEERDIAHQYVLLNTDCMQPMIREYEAMQAVGTIDQPMAQWIRDKVRDSIKSGVLEDGDIRSLSVPPSFHCRSYKSMKAYGNHYRVETLGNEGYVSYDSGIASIFLQTNNDRERALKSVSYVGTLQDVIQLNYGLIGQPVILMKGKWFLADWKSRNATMKTDSVGFLLVNSQAVLREWDEPFVFPSQVEQIFFVDDYNNKNWKVVLRKEPRSRRVVQDFTEVFAWENEDHVGLVAPSQLPSGERAIDLHGAVLVSKEDEVHANQPIHRTLPMDKVFDEVSSDADSDIGEDSNSDT